MNGSTGPAAQAAIDEAAALATVVGVPVVTFDERRTTVTADRAMMEANMRAQARRRDRRQGRGRGDAAGLARRRAGRERSSRRGERRSSDRRLGSTTRGTTPTSPMRWSIERQRRSHRSVKYLVYFAGIVVDRRPDRRRLRRAVVPPPGQPAGDAGAVEVVHGAARPTPSTRSRERCRTRPHHQRQRCSAGTSTTTAGWS